MTEKDKALRDEELVKRFEESTKNAVKEALEINCVDPQFVLDLKNKGFDIDSILDGVQVTIVRAKGTDKEEDFTGFGESVEEAVDSAMPMEYTDEQKQKVVTRLEADLVGAQAELRKLDKDIAKTDVNIQHTNEELAKTYGNLARIYRTLADLG